MRRCGDRQVFNVLDSDLSIVNGIARIHSSLETASYDWDFFCQYLTDATGQCLSDHTFQEEAINAPCQSQSTDCLCVPIHDQLLIRVAALVSTQFGGMFN
jgi:hypothetical protein